MVPFSGSFSGARERAAMLATVLVAGLSVGVSPAGADPPVGDVGVRSQALFVGSDGGDSREGDGPSWQADAVGVNAADGNLLVHEIDDPIRNPDGVPGPAVFNVDRWYNSRLTSARDVGKGWTTALGYDVRLTDLGTAQARFYTPSQHVVLFDMTGTGPFEATNDTGFTLSQTSSGWLIVAGPLGRTYEFDGSGKLTKVTDLDSDLSERFEYTSAGGQDRLSAVFGPRETASRFSFNGNGQIIELDNPASQHGYYTYSGVKLATVTHPNGQQSVYGYDGGDRLNSIARPGYTLAVTYDGQGRVTSFSETRNGTTTTATLAYVAPQSGVCDPSRDASQTNVTAAGQTTSYCFDANGNLTAGAGDAELAEQTIPLGNRAWAIGDVDTDRIADVVLVDKVTGAVSVRLRRENGTYGPELAWGSFGRAIGAVTIGDVDNFDNDDVSEMSNTGDIVGQSPAGDLRIRYSTGEGTFNGTQGGSGHQETWPTDRVIAVNDIDGDGQVDLWSVDPSSSDVKVALGGGTGFRDATTWGSVSSAVTVLSGDLAANDGQDDLVTYNPATGSVRVAQAGTSSFGSFQTLGFGPADADAVTGDLNGEGSGDMYFRVASGKVTAQRRSQAGSLQAPITLGTLPSSYRLSVADLTGDGPLSVVGTRELGGNLLVRGLNVAAIYTGP